MDRVTARRAFSLVELVVAIGIISLISGVVFFNYPQFNQAVLLNRAARELTVTMREAQAKAISVAPLPDGTFPTNYGVFVDSVPEDGRDGVYVLFSDLNGNLKYDAPADPTECSGECVKRSVFASGVQMSGFTPSVAGGMNILYYRPGPLVIVSDHNGSNPTGVCIAADPGTGNGQYSGACAQGSAYGPFQITLSRPSGSMPGESRTIEVWRTGQISIR